MSQEQVTIKDIAKRLNIAPSTVSRALKDHPDISESTKKAVIELARELDYEPNIVALSLRKSKTFTIGVIVPEIVHYFFSSVISGMEDLAYSKGYNVIVCQSNEDYNREVLNTKALMQSRVDGLIVSVSKNTIDFEHLKNVQEKGVPIVFFDRIVEGMNTSSVVVEDYKGAYGAVKHLINSGRKYIVHLCSPDSLSISRERKKGYIDAIEDHGIAFNERRLVIADNFWSGYEAINNLLADYVKIDAVFGVNDLTAIGAMKALKEHNLKIPEDVAVVGFSDDPKITELLDPPLSSVYQPGYEMGETSVELLLKAMDEKTSRPIQKVLETKLIIRDSSKLD
jgi:LacI family transcriptional regulator